MADTSPVFAPDVLEQQRISQRQQLAQALMNQGANQGQTQVINGFAVRNSPWLGLVNMLAAGYGGKLQREAQQDQAALDTRKQQALADALRQLKTDPDSAIDTLASNPATSQLAAVLASKQFERNMPKPFDPSPFVGKYSPESIEQFRASGSYGDLKPVGMTDYQQQQLEMDRARLEIDRQRNANQQARNAYDATQGKVPAGYRLMPDGSYEAIKGGPADLKLQGAYNQDTAALQGSTNAMDRLAEAANELLMHPGLSGITGMSGALPNLPGGKAADAESKLNTLKSQVAFGVLQDMRNNSKTGGALGAVSDAEGKRLESNLASLEKAQSLEAMQESLRKIIKYSDDAKDRLRGAYNLKHGDKTVEPSREQKSPSAGSENKAPPEALDFLSKNPSLAPAFKAKYGYLPEGF